MLKLHKRPRKIWTLILGIISLLMSVALIVTIPPTGILPQFGFFILLFGTLYGLVGYILNHTRRAFLISGALTLYLFLRSLGLTHWIYPLLILAIYITIEFYRRKH